MKKFFFCFRCRRRYLNSEAVLRHDCPAGNNLVLRLHRRLGYNCLGGLVHAMEYSTRGWYRQFPISYILVMLKDRRLIVSTSFSYLTHLPIWGKYQEARQCPKRILAYAEIKHSNWLKLVVWRPTANQSALFQHSLVMLLWNLFTALPPALH